MEKMRKCTNDFWHKTHFFLCYNVYFFLVHNIIKRQNVAWSFFSATQLSFSQNVVAIRTKKDVQIRELDSAPAVENFRPKKKHFLLAKPMHLLQWRLHPLRCPKLIWWAMRKVLFWTQCVISTLCVQQRQQTSFRCHSFIFFCCQMGVAICRCIYQDRTSGLQLLSFNRKFPFLCVLQEWQPRLRWQPANSTSISEILICSNAICFHFYGACGHVIEQALDNSIYMSLKLDHCWICQFIVDFHLLFKEINGQREQRNRCKNIKTYTWLTKTKQIETTTHCVKLFLWEENTTEIPSCGKICKKILGFAHNRSVSGWCRSLTAVQHEFHPSVR